MVPFSINFFTYKEAKRHRFGTYKLKPIVFFLQASLAALSLSQLLVWYANSSLSLLGNHLFLNIFYTKTQTHIFIYVYIYIYWCGAVLVDVQNSPPPTSASGGTQKILSTTMPETCC